jgi:DivIVA domain-containing protein
MTTAPLQPANEPTGTDGRPTGELPAFDRVARGYHAGQVDDFLRRVLHRLHQAEEALAQATGHAVTVVENNPRARQLVDELMQIALDEITGQKTAALAQAAQILDGARAQAAQITGSAQDEARSLVGGAREQSDTLLASARADAKRHLDTAAAQAAAVQEGAGRRMQALVATHGQTLARLAEINGVTTRLLAAEESRGDLQGEVDLALGASPPAAVQASAPGRLTASADGQS